MPNIELMQLIAQHRACDKLGGTRYNRVVDHMVSHAMLGLVHAVLGDWLT
jgi:hypothetical protein